MYKHILLPTDGTKLSEKAIKQGVGLAQALNARVTAITVSPAASATASEMVGGGPSTDAAQHLARVRLAADSSKVAFHGVHVASDEPLRGDRCCGKEARLRSDRDGLTWSPRHLRTGTWERYGQSAHSHHHSGARMSLNPCRLDMRPRHDRLGRIFGVQYGRSASSTETWIISRRQDRMTLLFK